MVGAVFICIPWGGDKYGRVIWELGGYLFWPFGKYVEGWSDGDEPDEPGSGADGAAIDEEDEERLEDDLQANMSSSSRTPRDLEQAGRTFSRGHATSSRSSARVDEIFADADSNLPDEPLRATNEVEPLIASNHPGYGAVDDKGTRSSSEDTIAASRRPHDFTTDNDGQHALRVRALPHAAALHCQ